jgi:predicted RecB family nuclease
MTEKERKKLRNKGIFTVTQLSYTFRPRRLPKRLRGKKEKYHHSLRALAVREKKIHIVGSPELKIAGTPVYLDVEGVPDRDFYYLIGARLGNGESAIQHSLWADSVEDEKIMWTEFLRILADVDNPLLIHYGSYETTFIKRMCARYGLPLPESMAGRAVRTSVNLLSVMFAQIYFPTFSNSLKDVGHFLGTKWDGPVRSGWQSLARRLDWEQSRDPFLKRSLVNYNLWCPFWVTRSSCLRMRDVRGRVSDPGLYRHSGQCAVTCLNSGIQTAPQFVVQNLAEISS